MPSPCPLPRRRPPRPCALPRGLGAGIARAAFAALAGAAHHRGGAGEAAVGPSVPQRLGARGGGW
eukprot:11174735-Lingulodinium_polyedra.AAC.1